MEVTSLILVGGSALIVLVVIHGFVLSWRRKRPRYKVKLVDLASHGFDRVAAELPNGGAVRIVTVDQPNLDLEPLQSALADSSSAERPTETDPAPLTMLDRLQLQAEQSLVVGDRPVTVHVSRRVGRETIVSTGREQKEPARSPRHEKDVAPVSEDHEESVNQIVLFVVSNRKEGFGGTDLKVLFDRNGLVYSNGSFERPNRSGETAFSVVNAIAPGKFSRDNMANVRTRGIALFMRLHELRDPATSLETMYEFAVEASQKLGGQLRDENREEITAEKIDSYRNLAADALSLPLSKSA